MAVYVNHAATLRNLHESNEVSLWWSIRKLSYRLVCNIRWDTNLRFVDWKGKRQCEIFDLSKEKEIETHRGKIFFSEETEVYIGWEVKKDNLLSKDRISLVKAS